MYTKKVPETWNKLCLLSCEPFLASLQGQRAAVTAAISSHPYAVTSNLPHARQKSAALILRQLDLEALWLSHTAIVLNIT
jgi:hypothetical protein